MAYISTEKEAQDREATGNGDSLETSQPIPSDISPPTKTHILILCKQFTNWDQALKLERTWWTLSGARSHLNHHTLYPIFIPFL